MALKATVYRVSVELADADRHVYRTLDLRVARHPSETEEYLVTRVLAYALEVDEGIEFTAGLAEPDEPAISVRDLTGARRVWIDVGAPEPARLHRAAKTVDRVVVYTHRDAGRLVERLAGARVHRADALEIFAVDPLLVRELALRLERRMTLGLTRSDGVLYVTIGGAALTGTVASHRVTRH